MSALSDRKFLRYCFGRQDPGSISEAVDLRQDSVFSNYPLLFPNLSACFMRWFEVITAAGVH